MRKHITILLIAATVLLGCSKGAKIEPAEVGAADKEALAIGENVELAYVDQGYTGEQTAADAAEHGLRLEVVKHHEAKRGFVLLPRRGVVERSFAWAARFRRLARDDERLATAMAGCHWVAFTMLMLQTLFRKSS